MNEYMYQQDSDGRGVTYLVFDELLPSINDIIESILVSNGDIAGFEPPVGSDGVLRRRGVVEIALNEMPVSRSFRAQSA